MWNLDKKIYSMNVLNSRLDYYIHTQRLVPQANSTIMASVYNGAKINLHNNSPLNYFDRLIRTITLAKVLRP